MFEHLRTKGPTSCHCLLGGLSVEAVLAFLRVFVFALLLHILSVAFNLCQARIMQAHTALKEGCSPTRKHYFRCTSHGPAVCLLSAGFCDAAVFVEHLVVIIIYWLSWLLLAGGDMST